MGVRVLLIEDDETIAEPLAEGLGHFGLTVDHVSTGAAGLRGPYGDVVLLDLGLPDMDGIDVCRGIRQYSDVPVIILSARGEEADRVLGLELGADDYLAKPFSLRELVARIRAVTRRTQQGRGIQPGLTEGEFMATPPGGTPVVGPFGTGPLGASHLGTGPLGSGTLGAGVRVTGLLGDGPAAAAEAPGAGAPDAGPSDSGSSDAGYSNSRYSDVGSSDWRSSRAEGAYESGSSASAGSTSAWPRDAEPRDEPRAAEPREEKPFRGESFGGEPFAGESFSGESFSAGPDMPGRDTPGWDTHGRGIPGRDSARREPAGRGGSGQGSSEPGNTGRGRAGSGEPGSAGAGADTASAARPSYDRTDGTGTGIRARSSYDDPSGGTGTRSSYGPSGATRAPDPYDSYESAGDTRASTSYDSAGGTRASASYGSSGGTRAPDPYDHLSFDESSRSFDAGPAFEFAPPVPAGRPRRAASAGPVEGALDAESESEPVAETPPAPGPLVVDRRTRQVWVGDSPVSLTPKEFELLALLTEDPGAVYSRQQILDRVWDPHYQGPTKTLDVHVATLRRKLGNSAWIQTLRGVGFRLAVQNRPPSAGGATGRAPGGSYGEQPGRPNGSYGSYDAPGSTGSYGSFGSFESFGSSGAYDDLPDGGSHEARPAAFR